MILTYQAVPIRAQVVSMLPIVFPATTSLLSIFDRSGMSQSVEFDQTAMFLFRNRSAMYALRLWTLGAYPHFRDLVIVEHFEARSDSWCDILIARRGTCLVAAIYRRSKGGHLRHCET